MARNFRAIHAKDIEAAEETLFYTGYSSNKPPKSLFNSKNLSVTYQQQDNENFDEEYGKRK